jgi:Ca2+-transporting ATPase
MATFHRWTDHSGRDVMRCFIKGAPDVLAERADRYLGGTEILPLNEAVREGYARGNAELAGQSMRALAMGAQDFPVDAVEAADDPKHLLDRIVLVALVGIVDPPRPEARQAIAECRDAGIRVRMITGDHAVTAGAIAADLGVPGARSPVQNWTGSSLTRSSATSSTRSGWSPGSHPSTRSGSCARCNPAATSSP